MEQIAASSFEQVRPSVAEVARRFTVWDYSLHNVENFRALGLDYDVKHVPIGYAPILSRIPKQEEDIDVLLYGLPSARRLNVFARLCAEGLSCVFLCGLYGAGRDSLIARSKLVLNITLYEKSKIFEIVRVSYLLANRKAVVAEMLPGARLEDGLQNAVAFATANDILTTCQNLISDEAARKALEESGFEIMGSRDICGSLSAALQ